MTWVTGFYTEIFGGGEGRGEGGGGLFDVTIFSSSNFPCVANNDYPYIVSSGLLVDRRRKFLPLFPPPPLNNRTCRLSSRKGLREFFFFCFLQSLRYIAILTTKIA